LLRESKEGVFTRATLSESDDAAIMYTSGTTGKPKGAILHQRGFVLTAMLVSDFIQFEPEDKMMCCIPLFHIAGTFAALVTMHVGGRNVMISKFDPKVAGKMIDQEKITLIGDFPPILLQLLDEQAKGEFTLSTLKHILGIDMQETINSAQVYEDSEISDILDYSFPDLTNFDLFKDRVSRNEWNLSRLISSFFIKLQAGMVIPLRRDLHLLRPGSVAKEKQVR
jgi:acyl-CoA synthetase (AMP-forming)/AMP-acid ligase II